MTFFNHESYIKISNILLDKNLQPKIADFGLAILFPNDKKHIYTSHVASTKVDASYSSSLL
jgi:serine/threonine protein kinase